MSESSNSEKYSRRKSSFSNESIEDDKEKMEEAFTDLSAHVIAKLIEDEPDSYSIEDSKVIYK